MQSLKQLCKDVPGCAGIQHGPNLDFERKSPDHPYGFIAQLHDRDALVIYAESPGRKALGAWLVALCDREADGIVVCDFEVAH